MEGQLEWVQSRQALCPCIRSRTLASVREGSEEGASESSGEEVPTSSTSRPVSMTAVGSFRWGSEAGTAVGEAWGQEPDEEDGEKDEDTFMARQVQIFEANEAEREAVEWLAANPTRYKPEDSRSSVDVDRTIDLFDLADRVRKIAFITNLCRTLVQISVYTTSIFLIQVTTHIHFTSLSFI